jgi:hypothetical protein
MAFFAMSAVIFGIGIWILVPIDRAAKARDGGRRISVSDFLCLFIAVQLPLTAASLLTNEDTKEYFWILTALAWTVAPLTWITCAMALSRAKITRGSHRLVFMGFVLPVVYYGIVPFAFLTTRAVDMVLTGQADRISSHLWLASAWVGMAAALIASGLYTNWLVNNTHQVETHPATNPDSGTFTEGCEPVSNPVLTSSES